MSSAALVAALPAVAASGDTMTLKEAKDAVDHLVLGVSDLQQGIEWVEKRTGVRAVFGGKHPNRGTQNALLSFSSGGGRQYLEIMAPDPQQAGHERIAELQKLTSPRLILWASATAEINAVAQQAKAAGLMAVGPLDGSRARPDGKMLKWRTLNVAREAGNPTAFFNVIPFFIQWDKDSLHPSQDSPTGCQLLSLRFEHPEAEKVMALMRALGIQAEVGKAPAPAIKATLKTPKGEVQLT